jgi:hypothetical protein
LVEIEVSLEEETEAERREKMEEESRRRWNGKMRRIASSRRLKLFA